MKALLIDACIKLKHGLLIIWQNYKLPIMIIIFLAVVAKSFPV